jgi:GNAT superfamily N-acetyltransferase
MTRYVSDDGHTVLRRADASDAGIVHDFIVGLAVYEKLEHEVVCTPEMVASALGEKNPVIEVMIAEYDGEPAGFAIYFRSFSTFLGKPGIYLEDLFVRPELRGKGIGRSLLVFLAKIAVERGYGRVEWSVLDWNEPAIGFYRKLGAIGMDEWTVNRVTGAALEAMSQSIELKREV